MQKNADYLKKWLGTGAINIFGLPFSGKDTQAKLLAESLNASFISSGSLLRAADKVNATLNQGELAPTEDFIKIVLPHFRSPKYADRPLVLSSIGRWHSEEQPVMTALAESNHPLRAVILLTLPEAQIIERYESSLALNDRGKRGDDNVSVLQRRISEFNQKTLPVIEFYEQKGLLVAVNGNQSRQDVSASIMQSLENFAGL